MYRCGRVFGGALNLIIAASLNPEKFRNIVLVSPVGLLGKTEEGSDLIVNFSKEVVSGFFDWLKTTDGRAMMASITKSVLGRVLGSPAMTWKQVIGMTNVDLLEELKYLRESGIKISVVHGTNDKLVSTENVNMLLDTGAVDAVQMFDGAHPDFLFKAGKVVEIVDSAFDSLAENRHSAQLPQGAL